MSTRFYLMRHAAADYSGPDQWNTRGWGYDLAPLSEAGRSQANEVVDRVRHLAPEVMICSPTTRTMETAMHLVAHLSIPFRVEFDLHEWVPDLTFAWGGFKDVQRIQQDFDAKDGVRTEGGAENWESFAMMRQRMNCTLLRYATYQRVLVVCHGMVMRALTGQATIANTEILTYRLPE